MLLARGHPRERNSIGGTPPVSSGATTTCRRGRIWRSERGRESRYWRELPSIALARSCAARSLTGHSPDRKSAVSGTGSAVPVYLGGCSKLKKTQKKTTDIH